MNSQRLEEIVAELMKPISDVRRSFDTDLSALLEEYLTEAGLHALEAGEGADEDDLPLVPAVPNFAELALLLQHSASVYGRKVDFLYQHVLSVSDSLQNSTHELERGAAEAETVDSPCSARRRRAASTAQGFAPLELSPCSGAVREPSAARPPPTLPRVYVELEPRQMSAADRPLTDYDGEPVGLLADFHVAWRLQGGMLVDELDGWDGGGGRSLRPIPLMELQAAIEAAAPPALPPQYGSPAPSPLPLHASTPIPEALDTVRKERKRRADYSTDDLVGGCFKIRLSKELRRKLRKLEEFSVDSAWIAGVVASRKQHVLRERTKHAKEEEDLKEFRGFDASDLDVGGFAGWSSSEAAAAADSAEVLVTTQTAAADDSDDDGFFEQSSLGDSDVSGSGAGASDASWAAWQASVLARSGAGETRGLDVVALAERVLRELPEPAPAPAPEPAALVPGARVLRAAAGAAADVPGLFLATLFLANAGNVEVVQGPPLTLGTFSLRLQTRDPRRYSAAARDPAFAAAR